MKETFTQPIEKSKQSEKPRPTEIMTAKGSVYTYLPDGRTERFKKATGEHLPPQDALVFIPPWDAIKEQAEKIYPNLFKGIENNTQYEQVLLEYVQRDGHTVRIVDANGKELKTNAEIEQAEKAFAYFVDKIDQKNSFHIPISKEPKVGYTTFDTRKFVDEKGETRRERHMGNKVTEIKYEEKPRSENGAESENLKTPENSDKYYKEALSFAQKISKNWETLREKKKQDPNLLYGHPKLEEIDAMSRPPISGIQKWFESQVESIDTHARDDENARSRMMYRLLEDLQWIDERVQEVTIRQKIKEVGSF
jgi:hypothetical protein